MKKQTETAKQKARERYVEELIEEVVKDFERRREERIVYERQWELNMNFLAGNQYCGINSRGEIESENREFYWQNRGVFNHVAPLIESRLAKLALVAPEVSVRPETDDDKDVMAASLAEKLIAGAFKRADVNTVVKKVTAWSEACGSGFYKIVWKENGGEKIGEVDGVSVYDGDVEVLPISPFEIFPDSLYAEDLRGCNSIIHAKAVPVCEIKERYGVDVVGEEIGVFNLTKSSSVMLNEKIKSTIENAAIVIERYERPTEKYPNGRMITVAGNKLLYVGDLPYVNGENGGRDFPFVKQDCTTVAGSFFGISIIERLIPIQRAFNAVKNRKHEFMNRLTMGVMTVEDGSIDVDDLAEEGLSPGKVLVYRQGSKAPEIMSDMTMPTDFNQEEDKLINEFVTVSGVSDVSSSSTNAKLSSGSALEILVEQDNSRMTVTAEYIRRAYVEIARQAIRLFAQFTVGVRAIKYKDSFNKTKISYADRRVVKSDDVYLESENELLYSHSQRKSIIFKLYESGLLTDEEGKLRPSTKEKVLSLLGYKDLDYQRGLAGLHEEKAQKENEWIRKEGFSVEEIDDDRIHIDEHVRYVLSEYQSLTDSEKQRLYAHVKEHKQRIINNLGEK